MSLKDLFNDVTIDEEASLEILDDKSAGTTNPTVADIRKEYHIRKLNRDHGATKVWVWSITAVVGLIGLAVIGCQLKTRGFREAERGGNTYISMNTVGECSTSTDADPTTVTDLLTSSASARSSPAKITKSHKSLEMSSHPQGAETAPILKHNLKP